MNEDLRHRPAAEVFDDHLSLAAEHRFEEDIERNVAPHCVIEDGWIVARTIHYTVEPIDRR